jgi:hypothetical protein
MDIIRTTTDAFLGRTTDVLAEASVSLGYVIVSTNLPATQISVGVPSNEHRF